jgi:hypothetical protein
MRCPGRTVTTALSEGIPKNIDGMNAASICAENNAEIIIGIDSSLIPIEDKTAITVFE